MKSRRSISPFVIFFGTVVFLAGLLLWAYGVFLVCHLLGDTSGDSLVHGRAGLFVLGALGVVSRRRPNMHAVQIQDLAGRR